MSIKTHSVHLHTPRLGLRPMTAADWDILLRWNQDPEVLIHALVEFGFGEEKAEFIFACGIADYNPRSLAAFSKVGFRVVARIDQPPGDKASSRCDMRLARTDWFPRPFPPPTAKRGKE